MGFLKTGFRWFGRGTVVAGVTTAALCVPPIETVPAPLVQYRVTAEAFGRALRCLDVAAKTVYEYKWKMPSDPSNADWEEAHQQTANRLVDLAIKNSAIWIKIGQNFSTNNHVLHPIYCKTLKRLCDKAGTRPISEIKTVILEDFPGQSIEEIFSEFDERPIASASLAQVHRARLRDTGDDVAVKVQYIDCQRRFDGDFNLIMLCLKIAGTIFEGFDFGPLIKQGAKTLRAELFFDAEGENLIRCAKELETEFGDRVTCPHVFKKWTTQRVLVTEFIDGCAPDDLPGLESRHLDAKEVATLLSDTFAFQLFKLNPNPDESYLTHADPHSGNIRIHALKESDRKKFQERRRRREKQRREEEEEGEKEQGGVRNSNNKKKEEKIESGSFSTVSSQVVLLDLGLAYEMTQSEKRDLSEVWTCCATRDREGLKKIMEKLGLPNDNDEEVEVFGSTFLQAPFSFYDRNKKNMTADLHKMMQEGVEKAMPIVSKQLEKLPEAFIIALRNISTYRAVHKNAGNQVSRAERMLRYSLVTARSETRGWVHVQLALLSLWYNEMLMKFTYWFTKTVYGIDIEEAFDETLTSG